MLTVIMLNVIMLTVIMLNVIMLSVILLNVIALDVNTLNVIMLNIVAPVIGFTLKHYTRLKKLAGNKYLLGQFVIYEGNKFWRVCRLASASCQQ
jgi:hypothetical protein